MTDASDFDRAFTLLAIVADAPACKARLAELQKQIDAAAAAQSKLDASRAEHERAVARSEGRAGRP